MRAVVLHEPTLSHDSTVVVIIRDTLELAGWRTDTADASRTRPHHLAGCDLMVVGAPTHSFPGPRPRRALPDTDDHAPLHEHVLNVREWLTLLDEAFPATTSRPQLTVFTARHSSASRPAPSAARQAARVLAAQGFELVGEPTTFFVQTDHGVPDGEVARIEAWVRAAAARVSDRVGVHIAQDGPR